jgi:hypothetical protein
VGARYLGTVSERGDDLQGFVEDGRLCQSVPTTSTDNGGWAEANRASRLPA